MPYTYIQIISVFLVVYVIGGLNQEDMFSDSWKLDLEKLSWTKLPFDMVEPVYFHSTAIDDEEGKVVTFGGVTDMSNK